MEEVNPGKRKQK